MNLGFTASMATTEAAEILAYGIAVKLRRKS